MKVALNREQALAAEHLIGPVLVTAGAGSGKTRMITERFANAVVPGRLEGWTPVETDNVVAITFTEKAAGEIAERVRSEIGNQSDHKAGRTGELWISTIHGFCARILRRSPFEAGIDPLFSVADTLEAGRLREQAFRDALTVLDGPDNRLRDLLDTYQTETVYAATLEVVRQLSVAGLGANAICLETPHTARELLSEAEALFGDGTSTCDIDYTGSSTAHIQHSEQCRELLMECATIASLDHSEQGTLESILGMAERYKPLKKLKGFEEINEEMTSRKGQLAARAATAVVFPYAAMLGELVTVYSHGYRQLKQRAGMLDFEDLQTTAVELLDNWPEVAARYRDQFSVVMIDEFQDTDALQLRLVERIAAENLCTVGDEMQAIYGFRGADVGVYRTHRESMQQQGALVAELATNYRSHGAIIAFVNGVFSSSQYAKNATLPLAPMLGGRPPQPLDATLQDQPRVEVMLVDCGDDGINAARQREAAEIAERLAELRERGLDPGDVAVLLRAYTDAHIYADALAAQGFPAVIVGGGRFFGLAETAVMRALTRVIANVADEAALGLLLVSEFIPVSDDALLQLRLEAQGQRLSLWDLVCSDSRSLEQVEVQALERLRSVVEHAQASVGREPLEDVVLRAVEEAGYDLRLLAQGNMGRDAFANVLKFARRAGEFELREGSGPAGFSAYLDTKERLNDREAPDSAVDEGASCVRIMSIHASKGLEFPVVVVPDIGRSGRGKSSIVRTDRTAEQLLLALKTPQRDDDGKSRTGSEWFSLFDEAGKATQEEESDRVLYVALTRARDLLMVSGSGKLNPAKRSASTGDLVKLARVLGHDVPIGRPQAEDIVLGGDVVGRFRVIDLSGETAEDGYERSESFDAPPPAFGEPLGIARSQAWLPDSVSYTQLSEFERCPRQFRIRRVLGIAPPAAIASDRAQPKRLGSALHAALRLVSREGAPPDSARFQALARFFELDSEDAGRLAEAATRYCESDVAKRTLEAQIVMREAPISVAVGQGLFVLAGSIDLYARSGDAALIVDYKSGASGQPDELPERYRLQADCYALAALRDGCQSVDVVFVRPEVMREGQVEQVGFAFSAIDATRIEDELVGRYREIEESEFPPVSGAACTNCDVPHGMCEHRAASEVSRGRRS